MRPSSSSAAGLRSARMRRFWPCSSPTWASIALAAARAAGWSPTVFASTAALARKAKQMRSELVMQLVRDELSLLVVGVEDALHQFVVGAIQSVERLRERIDLRIEVADLRRSVAFGARSIIAGLKLRERRSGDPEGPDRAPDQKAGHADCGERHQSTLERILPRFVPDLVDLVRRIRDQNDGRRPAVLQRNRNDGCFGRGAGKGAKPARRLGLPVRLAENCGSKRRIADPCAHVPQMLKTGDEVLDHSPVPAPQAKGQGLSRRNPSSAASRFAFRREISRLPARRHESRRPRARERTARQR